MLPYSIRILLWVLAADGYLKTLNQSSQDIVSVSCSIDGIVTLLGTCVPFA